MVSLDEFHCSLMNSDLPGLNRAIILFRSLVPIPLDTPGPWIFVPDLHLLGKDKGRDYADNGEDFFHLGDTEKKSLMNLLDFLMARKSAGDGGYPDLKVIQLGDFHDLWREAQHWWGEDVRRMMERQLDVHQDLFTLFRDLHSERVIGNHEDALERPGAAEENSDVWPAENLHETMLLDLDQAGAFRMLILHGHQVDPGEKGIRRTINPIGARMARHPAISRRWRDEWKYEVALGACDELAPSPVPQDLIHYQQSPRNSQQKTDQKYYREIQDYAVTDEDLLAQHAASAQLAFIGHTHHPRIVMNDVADYRLVDSGSWVNWAVGQGGAKNQVHYANAQIGVLARNEVAIIQIGS